MITLVWVLWVLCELAIAACDLAEVIGSAIALNLLFGIPLEIGVLRLLARIDQWLDEGIDIDPDGVEFETMAALRTAVMATIRVWPPACCSCSTIS